jgi:hypothetical protein
MRAARRSFRIVLGKPGPKLSLRDESPAGENRKWNAGRRARPQAEGGASRLLRGASRTPLVCGQKTMRLPAFRSPFICRFFLRHCRARPGNPCGRKARSDLPIRLSEPQFSMDHRVKPGGDEEFCKTRALKNVPRERNCFHLSPVGRGRERERAGEGGQTFEVRTPSPASRTKSSPKPMHRIGDC